MREILKIILVLFLQFNMIGLQCAVLSYDSRMFTSMKYFNYRKINVIWRVTRGFKTVIEVNSHSIVEHYFIQLEFPH